MLVLVTADNLVQMFFGWEGVGLASYLLIGFWYKKPSANAAAIKAFVVNRVGDFGFALGIFGVFVLFGTVSFDTIFANAPSFVPAEGAAAASRCSTSSAMRSTDRSAMTVVCLLLFMGAMGKSAQVPLHTWLPDAMEGPTPVSALIHAATMVTAGVFMLARLSPLFELSHTALTVVTFIGAITAFFAATVGLVQNDIKRVIAYSTCSQLGYMFVALGVGAYGAAIFHLFTHAFFKALLFLGSGSVIHAVSDEQDMRKMGGLRKLIPTTYWLMVVGTLALTGVGIPATIIGTAGFFSKDAIIEAAFMGENAVAGFACVLLVIAAAFTSFYSWRLIFMTFHGEPRASHDVMHHVHESPPVMLVPLFILAAGSLFAGVIFHDYFIGEHFTRILEGGAVHASGKPHPGRDPPRAAMGRAGAVHRDGAGLPARLPVLHPLAADAEGPGRRGTATSTPSCSTNGTSTSSTTSCSCSPAKRLGRFLWKQGDGWLIDGFGPDGVSARVIDVTNRAVKLQSGYLYHYAFAMLIGVAGLVTWMMFGSWF